jgi:uncharacterized low-complexity protein
MRHGGIPINIQPIDVQPKEKLMKTQNKTLALVIGGAFAAAIGAAPVANAAENPFALKTLSSGYMVADHHEGGEKMGDGKCGAGKCGSNMKKQKAEEGSCGAKESKEGSCGADKKAKEGNCGADKKDKEGSCGNKS